MRPATRGAVCAMALLLLPMELRATAQPEKAAASDVVTAPSWSVGSIWHYSDGYALKVTSSGPGNTQFDRLDAPGQWFSRQGFLRKDLVSGTATRNTIFRTVPDQAGMTLKASAPLTFQREYLSNGKLMVHASSWSVEGRETITVPAGTFDCWIIVWRSRSLKSDWTGFERWWYSPETQNYVRLEYKYGIDAEGSRVLMRYQLGTAATKATIHPRATPPATSAPKASTADAAPVTPQQVAAKTDPTPVPLAELPPAITAQAAPVAKTAAKTAPKDHPSDHFWHVQIAASQQKAGIQAGLARLVRTQATVLKHLPSGIYAVDLPERGTFYRAWVGQFADETKARAVCHALSAHGVVCTVVKPTEVKLAKG